MAALLLALCACVRVCECARARACMRMCMCACGFCALQCSRRWTADVAHQNTTDPPRPHPAWTDRRRRRRRSPPHRRLAPRARCCKTLLLYRRKPDDGSNAAEEGMEIAVKPIKGTDADDSDQSSTPPAQDPIVGDAK